MAASRLRSLIYILSRKINLEENLRSMSRRNVTLFYLFQLIKVNILSQILSASGFDVVYFMVV